jgi:Uma2 family endonuclease
MTAPVGIPRLENGDRLSRDEFERRYAAMPECKKAELIEGIVYMTSAVRREHSEPHFVLSGWLAAYALATPQVRGADNSTLRLDLDNEPQPDLLLRLLQEFGGTCRPTADGYLEGPPELAIEIAASSASYDLHQKLNAYRRNGVREYLVWRTLDNAVDWFVLRGGRYERLPPEADGVLRSEVFPGLWLDAQALLAGDLRQVRTILEHGLSSPAHAAFSKRS